MRKKKQRMQKPNRIGIKISTTVVVILFAVLSYKTVTLHQKASEYQATLDQYQKDVEKLEQDRQEIEEQKEYVQSDAYVEELAREKLGLVYKDEVIFEADEEQ